MKTVHILATLGGVLCLSVSAHAGDDGLTPMVSEGGFYASVDGTYDNISQPTYALGWRPVEAPGYQDLGQVQSFRPRLNGWGGRGALGYQLPGSTVRFELGGSYTKADGSASQSTTTTSTGANLQFLDGSLPNTGPGCSGGSIVNCLVNGTLNSQYNAWSIHGTAAQDWNYGSIVLTPSITLFGSHAENKQKFSQTFTQVSGTPITGQYVANTGLDWTDLGARVGLRAAFPVTSWLTLDAGGSVGLAQRHASLSGNDAVMTGAWTVAYAAWDKATTVSTSADRTAFLVNAEVGVSAKATPTITVRGFAGLNYDSGVPGVSTPQWTGNAFSSPSTTAAGISFSAQTSCYVGGGVKVMF